MGVYQRSISERIKNLVDLIEPGLTTYDLCCDHGLVGLHAVSSGKTSKVVFVDVVQHIVDKLDKNISKHMPGANLKVLCSDAANIDLAPEPCNVIIAGVYAKTILKIIDSIPLARRQDFYVFSPHSHTDTFEEELQLRNLQTIEKRTVSEHNKTFYLFNAKFIQPKN